KQLMNKILIVLLVGWFPISAFATATCKQDSECPGTYVCYDGACLQGKNYALIEFYNDFNCQGYPGSPNPGWKVALNCRASAKKNQEACQGLSDDYYNLLSWKTKLGCENQSGKTITITPKAACELVAGDPPGC